LAAGRNLNCASCPGGGVNALAQGALRQFIQRPWINTQPSSWEVDTWCHNAFIWWFWRRYPHYVIDKYFSSSVACSTSALYLYTSRRLFVYYRYITTFVDNSSFTEFCNI